MESWSFPGDRRKATGFPRPSTIVCSFVFSPPLVRPTALSAVFSPAVGTFVYFDAGRVYAQILHIRICRQRMKYRFQRTIIPPFGKTGIHRLPGAISLCHCAPLRKIHNIPFSIVWSSVLGRPRFPVFSGCSSGLIRFHCSFANSQRFMSIFSHSFALCATFVFQTRPNYIYYMRILKFTLV